LDSVWPSKDVRVGYS